MSKRYRDSENWFWVKAGLLLFLLLTWPIWLIMLVQIVILGKVNFV